MFTNEFKFDKTVTTLLDETGRHSDVIVTIEEDGYVFIEQEDEDGSVNNLIAMPPHMFKEMIEALNAPEGAFRLEERTVYD
jgi:hypothetical protein